MLKIVVENFPGFVFWKDKDLVYLGANKLTADHAGLSDPSEFVEKTDLEMPWAANEAEAYRPDDRMVMERGQPRLHTIERQLGPGGEVRWLDTSKVPLRDSEGNVIGVLGTSTDITDKKLAEDALRQANLVLENSPAVLFRWRSEKGWPVELVSKNVIQFGYDPEDFLSGELHYASIFHPDDYEHVNAGDEEFLATGKDRYEQVYRILGKRGDIYWVDERTVAERDTEGNVTHLQGIVIDVTARMNAEQKLQESEARVRRLLEQTFDAIVIHRDNRILFANDAAVKIIGAEGPEEVIGRAISHFLVSGSEEVIKERMRLLYSRPGTVVPLLEEKFRRVDGGVIDTEVMAASYIEDDKPTVQVIFRDITERNRILNELKESEENFRILVENVPDAIFITVSESLAFANPAAVRLFGASSAKQLLGRSVLDLIDPRFHDIMRNRLHQLMVELEPVETIDEVYLKLDGTPIDVEVAAVPFR